MKTTINTSNAPAAIGPYVQAIQAGKLLFTSGQLGIDPSTGKLAEGVAAQTRQSMANVKAILEQAGLTMADIVKTTVYLKDMADFAQVNEIYQECLGGQYPARSCVQVAALPMGGLVEVEVIAAAI